MDRHSLSRHNGAPCFLFSSLKLHDLDTGNGISRERESFHLLLLAAVVHSCNSSYLQQDSLAREKEQPTPFLLERCPAVQEVSSRF